MRKFLASSLAAVTAAGAVAASAAPAEARDYRRYHRDNDNDAAAAAIVAGVAGLAIGAALAGNSRSRGYYGHSYYDPRYSYGYGGHGGYGYGGYGAYGYDRPYAYAPRYSHGYGYGYRTCVRKERFWDPYIGRHVTVKRRFAC